MVFFSVWLVLNFEMRFFTPKWVLMIWRLFDTHKQTDKQNAEDIYIYVYRIFLIVFLDRGILSSQLLYPEKDWTYNFLRELNAFQVILLCRLHSHNLNGWGCTWNIRIQTKLFKPCFVSKITFKYHRP